MEYITLREENFPDFLRLYADAFPPEERRPYADASEFGEFVRSKHPKFNVLAAMEDGEFVGFMSYWNFDGYTYIEHFAVSPELRGRNIGRAMMEYVFKAVNNNVLIEVELPETEMARRRIGFYKRLGFCPHHDIEYIQPPYSDGLSPLPLMLMTHGNVDMSDWQRTVAPMLREVYRYDNGC